MDFRDEQPENAALPMEVTESGIVIELRLLQSVKTESLSDVATSGILNATRLWHPEKAAEPIEVTPSGISIDFKLEQPENAAPIDSTESGIEM
jgi:hypothetical protein